MRKEFKEFDITSYGSVHFQEKNKHYIVIGDLHLGLEDALRMRGISIPRKQLFSLKTKIKNILSLYKKNDTFENVTIILNGDIKHEFSELTYRERKEIEELVLFLKENFKDVVVIRGNHDNFMIRVLEKHDIVLYDFYETEKFYIEHGHTKPKYATKERSKKIPNKHIIISHEHPAVTLRDEVGGKIKIDCFLIYFDKISRRYTIILPSFSSYSQGMDIISTPLEDASLQLWDKFEIYGIYEDEIFYFGSVEKLKKAMLSSK